MYSEDMRRVACRIYSMLKSLRKTSIILQVSHSTVSRWLQNPTRKIYRRVAHKSNKIAEAIRSAVMTNPFVTARALTNTIERAFGFTVSRELVRTVMKSNGFTKKKARLHSCPSHLPQATRTFVQKRRCFVEQGRQFVSLDETSFGRNGRQMYGYAPKGTPLFVRGKVNRMTTTSALVSVCRDGVVKKVLKHGSFNAQSFVAALDSFSFEPRTVVLLDNVAFHHSKVVTKYATEKGIDLLYVPPYSPWFNPVEGVFSIVKRKYYTTQSIDDAFGAVTGQHTRAFFDKSFSLESGVNFVV